MFGMGFSEILMIAVVAILFLGPEKLPEAMVQLGKFFNSFRRTVHEAKSTFEQELHISELKEEALSYRRSLQETADDISGFKNSVPNPARELEEALSVARSGMGDLDGAESLLDDEEPAPEPPASVEEYRALARKAMDEARAAEPEEQRTEKATDEARSPQSSRARKGFKNLDGTQS